MTNNKNSDYQLVCGLEIHAELKTKSKMFCGCKNDPFGANKPNIYTCPVCLGMPGGLPVANQKAIEWTIKLGLALNCQINLFSKFDRKHYFYPDLPKGYQISQYDLPFCHDGYLNTDEGRIRIRRIHLEEDTGKLLHKTVNGQKVSLIDFNRGGVPLVEIVTEPDIKTPEQAAEYGRRLRKILRYLEIADCNMEQGGMRLEANISLQKKGDNKLPAYKVEVKNINSFNFMKQAVEFEMQRQRQILEQGKTPKQETRGFNPHKGITFSQRSKEEAEDYRYFPDPDLPPFRFSKKQIEQWRQELPILPDRQVAFWSEEYRLEPKLGEMLIRHYSESKWWTKVFQALKNGGIETNRLVKAVINKKFAVKIGQEKPTTVAARFIAASQTENIDAKRLRAIIREIMAAYPQEVTNYRQGKDSLINFFLGQTMRRLGSKKVDVGLIRQHWRKALSQDGD